MNVYLLVGTGAARAVVSSGTSLPELAVGIDAARSGSGPLTFLTTRRSAGIEC
jgi:hypothetical protein